MPSKRSIELLRSVLITAAIGLLWLVPFSEAFAWDPASFAQTLGEAQADYQGAKFGAALQRYSALESELTAALSAGEIPDDQKERALMALDVIRYQIGRCHQNENHCHEAHDAFLSFGDFSALNPELRTKLQVRLSEVHMCLAEEALASGDLALALNESEEASKLTQLVVLDESSDPQFSVSLATTRSKQDEIGQSVIAQVGSVVHQKLDAEDCEAARSKIVWAKNDLNLDTAKLEEETTIRCPVPPSWTAYAPIALMGTGGVLGLTAVILEVANSADVSELDDARDACLAGLTTHCEHALDLASAVDSQRTTTGVLVGLGVATAGAGLVWWLLQDDPGEAASLSILPSQQGATLAYRTQW